MNPTYDFTGQVALVTGASSGLGLATARAFAETGATVVLSSHDEDKLNAATVLWLCSPASSFVIGAPACR